jgi:SAM-dependent methyltransferase
VSDSKVLQRIEFPKEFDPEFYRNHYPDLSWMDDQQLTDHYDAYGRDEARLPNRIVDRQGFVQEILSSGSTLEIGPFFSPIAKGPNVLYFDVLSQSDLLARAKSLGQDHAETPHIDYVSPTGDLKIVNRTFDFVVSSNCLEHQPDLIEHLKNVERLLNPGGCYLALVPDKRYCHDHFMAESTIARALDAHYRRATTHPLQAVIEHVALSAHNDPLRHWAGDHGEKYENLDARIGEAMAAFSHANSGYLDVHSWYFTPESLKHLIATLGRLGHIGLRCIRCYDTRKYQNDFWMVLQNE